MMKRIILLIAAIGTFFPIFSQEYVRILDHKTTYEIFDNSNIDVSEKYRVLINSKEGYQYAVYRDYFDQYKSIKNLKLTILDPDDNKKIKRFNKGDANIIGFNSSYEINDSKIMYLDPDYHNYPFILQVEIESKYDGFISLPTWVPRPYFNIAVEKSVLEIIEHKDNAVKIKETHTTVNDKFSSEEGITHTIYRVEKLAHVDKKNRYKEFYDDQPKVYISPIEFSLDKEVGNTQSWKNFGDWFLRLNNKPYTLKEETKSFIDSLDSSDKRNMIYDIYRYMQNKTRYISIQLGIGGFQSIETEEVESTGYGDCKALTTYMKNMLDYAKIPSNYVLVRAGSDVPDVMVDFPSNQFNHVFLGVPLSSDTVLLECTSQILPADYIGTFTDDRNVLWIDSQKSEIIKSRQYKYDQNIEENIAHITISKNGSAQIELEVNSSGIFFDKIMPYRYAKKDYVEKINIANFSYKDFTIDEFSFTQENQLIPEFRSTFNIEASGLSKKVGDKMILPSNLLKPADEYVNYDKYLAYADILRGFTIHDTVRLNIPENYWIRIKPKTSVIKSEFGEYNISLNSSETGLTIIRSFYFKKGKYLRDDFLKFQDYLKQIMQIEKDKIILDAST